MIRRRLRFESLECRRLMAGNVTASVVEGKLTIVGDGGANSVSIESARSSGGNFNYRISGLPFNGQFDASGTPIQGTSPTLINGRNLAIVRVAAALDVNLGSGNDAVRFANQGNLPFESKSLVVNSGAGRDFVSVPRFNILNLLSITTGLDSEPDADVVRLGEFNGSNASYATNVAIVTGGGSDRVSIDAYQITNALSVNLGSGSDTLLDGTGFSRTSKTYINAGTSEHKDVIKLYQFQIDSLNVTLGAGDDLLFVDNVAVIGLARVHGGLGNDAIRFAVRNSIAREQETISIENGGWPFPPNA